MSMNEKDIIKELIGKVEDDTKEDLSLEMFGELEEAYIEFRKKVGNISKKHGINPYANLISYLEACIVDEKMRYENASGKARKVADALKEIGIPAEDLEKMLKQVGCL